MIALAVRLQLSTIVRACHRSVPRYHGTQIRLLARGHHRYASAERSDKQNGAMRSADSKFLPYARLTEISPK